MKNKSTAAILAFFLGGLGIHRFYLGQTGLGILYIVLCFFLISPFIALIDFICFLAMSKDRFDEKYNKDTLLRMENMILNKQKNQINQSTL